MSEVVIKQRGDLVMALGGIPVVHNPNSDKYKANATFAPMTVNLNVPVSVAEYRPPILYQGGQGACGQFTVVENHYVTHNAARGKAGQSLNAQLAHGGFLYEQARRRRGWFPNDSGSWPADGLDIVMADTPFLARHPFVDNPSFDYPDSAFNDGIVSDSVKSYRPIYVEEGGALELMWQALAMGWSLAVCMYWPDAYFNPNASGILPENVQWLPGGPAHAVSVWAIFPDRGGIVGSSNHWTERWNPQVVGLGNGFRPGDFAIPSSFFLPDRRSPVFQVLAVSPEAVIFDPKPDPTPDPRPDPTPDPRPTPDPQPTPVPTKPPVIKGSPLYKSGAEKLFVACENVNGRSVLVVNNIGVSTQFNKKVKGQLVGTGVKLKTGLNEVQIMNSDGQKSNVVKFSASIKGE